jgi:hypothetical protein
MTTLKEEQEKRSDISSIQFRKINAISGIRHKRTSKDSNSENEPFPLLNAPFHN